MKNQSKQTTKQKEKELAEKIRRESDERITRFKKMTREQQAAEIDRLIKSIASWD